MKQIPRKYFRFVRSYKLFSFVTSAALIAVLLQFTKHQTISNWVLASASVVALFPLVTRMVKDVRDGTYGIDILAALAIGASVLLQQFWAAIVIVIMLTGGESLEAFAERRARSELRDLLKHAPEHAHLIRKGKTLDVRVGQIVEHDRLVIKPGEVVPVDAIIIEGSSNFDESSLTGESLPQSKNAGDQILSGAINLDGVITAQATRTAAHSQYQQIVRLVEAAADNPAPFTRLADRYSIPFTIVALTIAGVAWILSRQPIRFLEVIVVATPCPLILATPIALIAGMSRAARDGIIIKTGTALEKLAQTKTFAFDKTGTLTLGAPAFGEAIAFKPYRKQEVIAYAAALEQASNHVLAKAVIAEAERLHLKLPKARHIHEIAGRGLEAHIQGNDVIVGRYSLLVEKDITIPRDFAHINISQTATYISVGGHMAGYITFTDRIRPESKTTLEMLRAYGIRHTLMVTGDNRTTAQTIAKELDIKQVVAETLPGDKLLAIEAVKDRPVTFVGDGVNDAPVLTAADIGIALGARGSTAASESADIVIMKDDLTYVARAVGLAKRSFRIASESIVVGISLSVALMLIFATGRFSPITGAITQEFVDVLVIFNALRAHRPDRQQSRKYRHIYRQDK